MGTVYKARQLSMNRVVALKILKKSEIRTAIPLDRLRREALIIARMDHPNIVKGIDMGETDRYYYFAMECVEGRSLKSILDLQGPMEESRALMIVKEVAKALHYAFKQKLIHRDIKPGNILINNEGKVKLTDLGLAKSEKDLAITKEGTVVGTPQYISPEQARTPKAADIRSDIYSLGATFYHMVTGNLPFKGETMAEMITQVLFNSPSDPEIIKIGLNLGVSRVISKMMAKDPQRRYQTPAELLDDLDVLQEALKDGSKELAGLVGMTWRESQVQKWYRNAFYLSGVGLLMLVVIFLTIMFVDSNGEKPTGNSSPVDPVYSLQVKYASGEITPLDAFVKAATLSNRDNMGRINALRDTIINDCKNIIKENLKPDAPRYHRALADGGFDKAEAALKRNMHHEIKSIIGGMPENSPPEIKNYWKQMETQALTVMQERVKKERQGLLESAIREGEKRINGISELIRNRKLKDAEDLIKRLEREKKGFMTQAAMDLAEKLASTTQRKNVNPRRFEDKEIEGQFLAWMDQKLRDLKERMRVTLESANHAFISAIYGKADAIIRTADTELISKGVDHILKLAINSASLEHPNLEKPKGLTDPIFAPVASSVKKLYEKKKKQIDRDNYSVFLETLIRDIDTCMEKGNYKGAKLKIQEAGALPGADPGILKKWGDRVDLLSMVDTLALNALKEYSGLDNVTLSTNLGYKLVGEILNVNPTSKEIRIRSKADQNMTIQVDDLEVEDILYWSGKVKVMDPWCRGLYAYYKDAYKLAEGYLKEAVDFEAAPLYLKRIKEHLDLEASTKEAQGKGLRKMLESVETAIQEGDWKKGFKILSEGKKKYKNVPGWAGTRRYRGELRTKLGLIQIQAEKTARLQKLFTIPVKSDDQDVIVAQWTFDKENQINDFLSRGAHWRIRDGNLECGEDAKDASADYYHNHQGVSFGQMFDWNKPIRLVFKYCPPFTGAGPGFMGINFYGQCFGIRSAAGPDIPGQVNAWTGDLIDYTDYFYYPNLGEKKPKKGAVNSFTFQKGETYEIKIDLIPNKSLRLMIDDQEVYSIPSFRLSGDVIEIRTFKSALIHELMIEGTLQSE